MDEKLEYPVKVRPALVTGLIDESQKSLARKQVEVPDPVLGWFPDRRQVEGEMIVARVPKRGDVWWARLEERRAVVLLSEMREEAAQIPLPRPNGRTVQGGRRRLIGPAPRSSHPTRRHFSGFKSPQLHPGQRPVPISGRADSAVSRRKITMRQVSPIYTAATS